MLRNLSYLVARTLPITGRVRALVFSAKLKLLFSYPDGKGQNRTVCYGKYRTDHDDRRNQRVICLLHLGTNGGQLVFRSDQPIIQRVDCSLKCGLCRGNLSSQIRLVAFVFCFQCRLGGSQRIVQCFDLIVQRLVAVCNGFVEVCFGVIEILLNLIYSGLK